MKYFKTLIIAILILMVALSTSANADGRHKNWGCEIEIGYPFYFYEENTTYYSNDYPYVSYYRYGPYGMIIEREYHYPGWRSHRYYRRHRGYTYRGYRRPGVIRFHNRRHRHHR